MSGFYLTKRICAEMLPHMRAYADRMCSDRVTDPDIAFGADKALRALAEAVDSGKEIKRGGALLDLENWDRPQAVVVRDILRDTLTGCTQMQVRKTLLIRIAQLDDHIGTSAIERLARLS